ncbi:hypothetical protein RND81_14G014900 [Saponaria officinalis]|uniref:Senescence regulator n=1 Tax=Saponaria officinalis TaxID=3572 RepID=A0AAW1GJV7_SAPOF
MASTKSYIMARRATTTNYRFLTIDASSKTPHVRGNSFDLNELDLWGESTQSNSAEFRAPPPPSSRKPRRGGGGGGEVVAAVAASVPVNVPDWSKILREEYKEKWNAAAEFGGSGGGDGGGDGGDEWVPPHEYLSRTRNASLSMQEGIGRTLKGRDLSRVRNAIWEKTGFQD